MSWTAWAKCRGQQLPSPHRAKGRWGSFHLGPALGSYTHEQHTRFHNHQTNHRKLNTSTNANPKPSEHPRPQPPSLNPSTQAQHHNSSLNPSTQPQHQKPPTSVPRFQSEAQTPTPNSPTFNIQTPQSDMQMVPKPPKHKNTTHIQVLQIRAQRTTMSNTFKTPKASLHCLVCFVGGSGREVGPMWGCGLTSYATYCDVQVIVFKDDKFNTLVILASLKRTKLQAAKVTALDDVFGTDLVL